jgi:hypothetical protein
MAKKISDLVKVKTEKDFKTFCKRNYIVLLAYTETTAVLYKHYGDRPASVTTRGGNDLDVITPNSIISVCEEDDDCVILITSSIGTLKFRCADEENRLKRGAVLFYGKPYSETIHVRNICNRSEWGCCDVFKIKGRSYFWMLKSILEPLLTLWDLRFNWLRFGELTFGCPFSIGYSPEDNEDNEISPEE